MKRRLFACAALVALAPSLGAAQSPLDRYTPVTDANKPAVRAVSGMHSCNVRIMSSRCDCCVARTLFGRSVFVVVGGAYG